MFSSRKRTKLTSIYLEYYHFRSRFKAVEAEKRTQCQYIFHVFTLEISIRPPMNTHTWQFLASNSLHRMTKKRENPALMPNAMWKIYRLRKIEGLCKFSTNMEFHVNLEGLTIFETLPWHVLSSTHTHTNTWFDISFQPIRNHILRKSVLWEHLCESTF